MRDTAEIERAMTVGEMARRLAASLPLLPERRCSFCDQSILWGAETSERYRQVMHAACSLAFDAATRRIVSQRERLGYQSGVCGWCRTEAHTLRQVTVPFDAFVCAPCRGLKPGEIER